LKPIVADEDYDEQVFDYEYTDTLSRLVIDYQMKLEKKRGKKSGN